MIKRHRLEESHLESSATAFRAALTTITSYLQHPSPAVRGAAAVMRLQCVHVHHSRPAMAQSSSTWSDYRCSCGSASGSHRRAASSWQLFVQECDDARQWGRSGRPQRLSESGGRPRAPRWCIPRTSCWTRTRTSWWRSTPPWSAPPAPPSSSEDCSPVSPTLSLIPASTPICRPSPSTQSPFHT